MKPNGFKCVRLRDKSGKNMPAPLNLVLNKIYLQYASCLVVSRYNIRLSRYNYIIAFNKFILYIFKVILSRSENSRALYLIFISKIHLKQNFHGTAVVKGQKVEAELTVFTIKDENTLKITTLKDF